MKTNVRATAKCLSAAVASALVIAGAVGTPAAFASPRQAIPAAAQLRAIHTVTYINPLTYYGAFAETGGCFKSEAQAFGYKVQLLGLAQYSNQANLELFQQAITDGSNAVFGTIGVPALFKSVIASASKAGVYIGGQSSGLASDGQAFSIGTNWFTLGKILADGVGAKYPDARVGFLSSSPSQAIQQDAVLGFKQEAKLKFPNMKMVAITYDQGDPTSDVDLVSNMLAAHPDINLLDLVPGDTAGGLQAVKERGLIGKVAVVGGDLTPDHRAALKDGTMWGVTVQDWCTIGKDAIIAFHDLATGKSIPFTWYTGARFVTKSDMPATGY